ncbi:MAG: dihydroorotase [Leptospirales bacterium]|nr:dihydroorotase [Leptospirales bacterium]
MPAAPGQILQIRQPDDFHLHLRDGPALSSLVGYSARQFRRAIVMPNLRPPVRSLNDALSYRQRIYQSLPPGASFEALMTLYLTEATTPAMLREAKQSGIVFAAKYYPAGATTNSESGVRALANIDALLAVMEEINLPLLVHGESIDPQVDVFDRERIFLERELGPALQRFPGLRVVLEHVTTTEGVDFVMTAGANVAATLTAHHLLLNRNALFAGGFRPNHYCLPVLKRESHRQRLLQAALSGHPRFFAGTDSAPHARERKEQDCGCAGIFTASTAVELYAEVFDQADRLDLLEAFLSEHGARFYRLPLNEGSIRLRKQEQVVASSLPMGSEMLVPLRAGESVAWTLQN